MRLPDNAIVRSSYAESEMGNLLVGQFGREDKNFFAIRTEINQPYMVILSASLEKVDYPYLCQPNNPPRVLDLGKNWYFNVPINECNPRAGRNIFENNNSVLLFGSGKYYIDLRKDGHFLELPSGRLLNQLPDSSTVFAWSRFDICIPNDTVNEASSIVFSWPEKE